MFAAKSAYTDDRRRRQPSSDADSATLAIWARLIGGSYGPRQRPVEIQKVREF